MVYSMSGLLHSVRQLCLAVAILLGAGPAAAATITTIHASERNPGHYAYYMNGRPGVSPDGAYMTFWTRDNWKSAMFRVSFPGKLPTWFILNCDCIVPETAWNYDPSRPYSGRIVLWMPPAKKNIFRLQFGSLVSDGNIWNPKFTFVRRDAWDAIPQMSFVHRFFGGELRHQSSVTLDDRSVTRYNFALGDVPARAGYVTDDAPYVAPLSAPSQPSSFRAPAPVPLPSTGLLVLTALAAVALARRGRRGSDPQTS